MTPTPSLWVWVPRTGGTSLWEWLCGHSLMLSVAPNIFHFVDLDVLATQHHLPSVWSKHAKGRHVFGVCRDPFARAASLAAYCGFSTVSALLDCLDEGALPTRMSKYPYGMNFAWPQSKWLRSVPPVETVLPLEEINFHIGVMSRDFGWPTCRLNRYNATGGREITERDAKRIAVRYAGDFANFNYPTQRTGP